MSKSEEASNLPKLVVLDGICSFLDYLEDLVELSSEQVERRHYPSIWAQVVS